MLAQEGYAICRTFYGSDDNFPFILNSYWHDSTGGAAGSDAVQELAVEFAAVVHVAMQNVLCSEARIYGTAIAFKSDGVVYTASAGAGLTVGNLAGDEAPDMVATVIRKRTALPGRSGYGRWFLGGVPESLTNTGALTDAGVTAYDTFSSSLIDDIVTASVTWVSSHYSHKTDTHTPILASHVDRWLGTQKRRQVRLPF